MKMKTEDIDSRFLKKESECYERVHWRLTGLIERDLENTSIYVAALKAMDEEEPQRQLERLEKLRRKRARLDAIVKYHKQKKNFNQEKTEMDVMSCILGWMSCVLGWMSCMKSWRMKKEMERKRAVAKDK